MTLVYACKVHAGYSFTQGFRKIMRFSPIDNCNQESEFITAETVAEIEPFSGEI